MGLHHRHKQRLLTTITTLLILTLSADVFLILNPVLGLELGLLFAFTVAIGLTVAYQCYNYRHSHEHLTLVNTLTQVFLGSILFASSIIILILHLLFGLDVLDGYMYMSFLVIVLTFAFLKKFDEFLEFEVKQRFPMAAAPAPKKRRKKSKSKR